MIAKSFQCQLTALAAATLLALASNPAAALSLGRVTVQSALGEPLQAEVDFLDINADEAASLKTQVATPEAFKAAGLEYNAALGALKTSLQRRANGRAYLKLSSDRVVNEPFVDLILEASWNSGRIVRDYTLLFDPPNLRNQAATAVPEKAQLPMQSTPAPTATVARSAPAAPTKAAAPKPAAPAPAKAAAKPAAADDTTVEVKPGDTASKIAAAHKPANVSLDQMLVAMLQNNPNAFVQDNVNRIKAGAVIQLPTPAQAGAIAPEEATQSVVAQSRDFNEFRRRLADNVPEARSAPAAREASGQVQATVQDKTPAATAPDKLTLSKGSVQAKSGEDQLAMARNTAQANARAAEVAKNISDLNKIAAAASAPVAAVEAAAPTAAASVPLPAAADASAVQVAASAPAVAAPAPKVNKPAAVLPEPAAATPNFIDTLVENPMLPGGVVALLGLLAGLAYFKTRQRKQDSLLDSAFAESSLADAFSGASGGQSVDTGDSLATGSSMVYSPSQIDAADDVDPVAEADVYLAYGRDLQAEEILKDALRNNPQRVAIHVKLCDIYAKRRDLKAFESIAALAFNLTDGRGAEWEQICEKGLSIDPDNALYLPGGQPLDAAAAASAPADTGEQSGATKAGDLDLDLDFSLDEPEFLKTPAGQPMIDKNAVEQPPTIIDQRLIEPGVEAPAETPTTMHGSLDFTVPQAMESDSQTAELAVEPVLEPIAPAATEISQPPTDFIADLTDGAPEPQAAAAPITEPEAPEAPLFPEFSLEPSVAEEPAPTAAPTAPADDATAPTTTAKDMLSFDLDSLSLDLDEDRQTRPGDLPEPVMDALETKLALAEEFRAIGDDDGARALIEEVIAEASGDVKAKAQAALNKL